MSIIYALRLTICNIAIVLTRCSLATRGPHQHETMRFELTASHMPRFVFAPSRMAPRRVRVTSRARARSRRSSRCVRAATRHTRGSYTSERLKCPNPDAHRGTSLFDRSSRSAATLASRRRRGEDALFSRLARCRIRQLRLLALQRPRRLYAPCHLLPLLPLQCFPQCASFPI